MEEYLTMKLKNHTLYDRKILFIMVNNKKFDMPDNIMKDCVDKYKKYIEENDNLSIIYDSRNLNDIDAKIAWKGASMMCKLNGMAKKNVSSSCLIVNNDSIKTLFNTITKIYTIVVPFKLVKNNNEALDFVTSFMK